MGKRYILILIAGRLGKTHQKHIADILPEYGKTEIDVTVYRDKQPPASRDWVNPVTRLDMSPQIESVPGHDPSDGVGGADRRAKIIPRTRQRVLAEVERAVPATCQRWPACVDPKRGQDS